MISLHIPIFFKGQPGLSRATCLKNISRNLTNTVINPPILIITVKVRKIIVGVILVALIASPAAIMLYSGTWPPIFAVESKSMEHSNNWTMGNINVGDIVLVKNIGGNPGNVVTYVTGKDSGQTAYGEYGNVILYRSPNNQIIIHRAMFYLSWDHGKPVVSGYTGQNWIKVTQNYVVIDDAGYTHRNLIVYLPNLVNKTGFVTMGDYNLAHSQLYNSSENAYAAADQNVFGYNPAAASGIVGVAYFQIPWMGLIKLNMMRISGQWSEYNQVPNFAYLYLGIVLASIVTLIVFPYERFMGEGKIKRKERKSEEPKIMDK